MLGGGSVGFRKAAFLARESDVTVLSRDFRPGFESLGVTLVQGEIEERLEEMMAEADIVVAATGDRELNQRIVDAAKGKLVNRDDGTGNFLIPSVVFRNGYTIAISTGGRSPGFSRYLRLKLESELGPETEAMVRLQAQLRDWLRGRLQRQSDREALLRAVLEAEDVWALLVEDEEAALDRAKAMAEDYL